MIKIGLIGCGIVTQKAHLPAIIKDSRFVIKALCRRNTEKLKEMNLRLPESATFTKYKDLIDKSELDGVLVATDVSNHLEIASYALENDLFVLLEKPVASNSANIQKFIEDNSSKIGKVMVGFNKRFYPSMSKFREYKNAGKFSKIIGGNISFATQQGGKSGKSGILQNLIHTCDLVCHIFGNPVEVESSFSKVINDGREGKTISSTIMTENDSVVSLFFTSSSNWKMHAHERLEIYDDIKGRVIIEDCDKILLSKIDKTQNPDNWGNYPILNEYSKQSNSVFFRDSSFGYEQQINAFGDLIESKLENLYPDMNSALKAQQLFESIFDKEFK